MEANVIPPASQSYMMLQYMDAVVEGKLWFVLNNHGARALSVCPLCKISDFLHSAECRLSFDVHDGQKIKSIKGSIGTKHLMKMLRVEEIAIRTRKQDHQAGGLGSSGTGPST